MACAVLIFATIAMLLISIHPFALRKIFLLALALLSLSSAICLADPLFMTKQYAPSEAKARSTRTQLTPAVPQDERASSAISDELSFLAAGDAFAAIGKRNEKSSIPSAIESSSPSTVRVCWLSDVTIPAVDDVVASPGSGL